MRIDFAYVRERVAIEALGYRWHGGRARWEGDAERHSLLAALGRAVVPVTWRALSEGPDEVVRHIVSALTSRAGRMEPAGSR